MHPPHTKQRAHRPSGSFSFGVVRYFIRVPGLGLVEFDRLDLARRRQSRRVARRASGGRHRRTRRCIAPRCRCRAIAYWERLGLLMTDGGHANKAGDGVWELVPCPGSVCNVACEFKVEGGVVRCRSLARDLGMYVSCRCKVIQIRMSARG